jgi:hypothetical protein
MPFRITRRIRIVAGSLLLLLAAYAAFGFWMVPHLVRGHIEELSARHWQRQPTLGDISFNPFTLALEIRKFAFADASGAPMMAFERLFMNLDISSLWRLGVSFREIELDQPLGRAVVRADGSFNLAELARPFAAAPGAATKASEPSRLFIDRLKLTAGAFEFEEHARARPFKARLNPVNFELRDFSTTGETGNNYSLQASSPAGEKFRWSGSFALAPLSSRGEFQLTDVQARTLWSYLQESLGFEVSNGMVGITGGYHIAATEPLVAEVNFAQVNVTALGLRPRGGETDLISLGKLALNDTRIDVGKHTVSIAGMELDEATVLARRDARGAVNLLALLSTPTPASPPALAPATAARSAEPPVASPAAPSWTVSAPEIDVKALRVELLDEFVEPAAAFTLAPVTLKVRGYSTAPGQSLDLDASVNIENGGGMVVVRGKGIPAEQTFAGAVKLDGLNLAAFQPYIGTYSQMTLLSGLLDADLDGEFKPGSRRLTGSLLSTRLHTVDNALREDFIKWDRLALNGVEYQSATAERAGSLRIGGIVARAPYIRFIIAPDQSTNVGKVLTMPGSAPGPVQTVQGVPTGEVAPPPQINIGRVQVENGSANFADFWITPNYAVSIQQLGGSISGLSSRKGSRAKIALNGKLDRYAPVGINGELNLLSATLYTDIHVKFDGVELTSVTPYSGRFAGYRIEKGKLSVDVRYKVEDRKLDAEQRFIIDQLVLGEKVDSPDAINLPLRLAVALLKDRNGVIDLGLPVTGSLDDPKFRLGPIVWKAFVNLLTGISTSPFKLLGGMFGGGEEVNLIDFDPGSATLDAAASEKLAALTKALRERPQLALEIPATYSPDGDYTPLAARQLEARLQALPQPARRTADVDAGAAPDAAQRFDLLLALHRAEKPGAPLPPGAQALLAVRARDRDPAALAVAVGELDAALRASIEVLETSLHALAAERARAIQDALLSSGEVEPGRVFMLAAGAQPAASGRVRVALSLK